MRRVIGSSSDNPSQNPPTDPPPPACHASPMDTRRELQQAMWEVIAEMERARLQGDDDQARRLDGIGWRLVGVIEGITETTA